MKPLINRPHPKKHESMESFLYRLSLANHYAIRTLAYFVTEGRSVKLNSLKSRKVFERISKLTLLPEELLKELILHRFSPLIIGRQFFHSAWKKIFILKKTRFCPECIGESKHHRLHWNLNPVIVCLDHSTVLLDRCTECNRKVGTVEILNGHCKCGVRLSTLEATKLDSDSKPMKYQKYIQSLLGIGENTEKIKSGSQVFDLSPPDFFLLLNLMSRHCSKFPSSSPLLQNVKVCPNLTREFVIYTSACEILFSWEDRFFAFLEEYKKVDKKTGVKSGVRKDFCGLFNGFDIKQKQFSFLREAFCDYLSNQWTGGIIKNNCGLFNKKQLKSKRFISIKEAKDVLKVSNKKVYALIETKKLSCITRRTGKHPQYLIESADVYELKKEMDKFLNLKKVSERLGLNKKSMFRLIKEGMLSTFNDKYPCRFGRFFRLEDIDEFEKKFLYNENFKTVSSISHKLVPIRGVVRNLSAYRMNILRLLELIDEGVIKPTLYERERGISRLYFDKSEIERLVSLLREEKVKRKGICLDKVAKSMNTADYVLKKYIDRGLLKSKIEDYGEKKRRYISEKDLENFHKEYVFTEEAADILKLTKHSVYKWIRIGRIKAYSGPNVDGIHRHLLKREELKKFVPLEDCLSAFEVASRLNVSKNATYELIKAGSVDILGGPGYDEGRHYLIHKSEIPKIKTLIKN